MGKSATASGQPGRVSANPIEELKMMVVRMNERRKQREAAKIASSTVADHNAIIESGKGVAVEEAINQLGNLKYETP